MVLEGIPASHVHHLRPHITAWEGIQADTFCHTRAPCAPHYLLVVVGGVEGQSGRQHLVETLIIIVWVIDIALYGAAGEGGEAWAAGDGVGLSGDGG